MVLRIIFTILIVCIIIAAFIIILFTPLKRYFQKKYIVKTIGHKVYKMAINYDYLVVHNYVFRLSDNATGRFDHLLFGDKFFYCIVDKTFNGGITGAIDDDSWTYYDASKNGDYKYIRNPLNINHNRTEKFALVTGLDTEDLISIVLVNDDCLISDTINPNTGHDYIIHVSELEKLVKEIESRDIGKIDEKQIEEVVQQNIMRTNRFVKKSKRKK